jgi:mRNA interferase MazF
MVQKEIWLANLNPGEGREQKGMRPIVIISGNVLNQYMDIIIACPLTKKIKNYKGNLVLKPSSTNGLNEPSEILTFQIRSISKKRLIEKLGVITNTQLDSLKHGLNDILKY